MSAFLVGLFLFGLSAQPSEGYFGRAYSEKDGEICFDLPQGLVDWEDLAKAMLRKKTLDRPSKEFLIQNYSEPYDQKGQSIVPFKAPVTPQVASRHWRLLHESGAFELRPSVLKGEVRYSVTESFELFDGPRVWGQACGVASQEQKKVRAAFVFSGTLESWLFEPAKWSPGKDGTFVIASAAGRHRITPPDFAVPRIKNVVVIRSTGSLPRALVSWASDPHCQKLCCEFAFSLYELGPRGRLVTLGESGYGCDV